MQSHCKMFICKKVKKKKNGRKKNCLQASRICISVQENVVKAVTENIPPLPSSALNRKLKKKKVCRQINGYFYFLLISNITVFGCCNGDCSSARLTENVDSMAHDDCQSNFCTGRGLYR